jgi:isoaspartyl peptidase/L-asparaginase-like protein (Ntn-hydrolase superfamily)
LKPLAIVTWKFGLGACEETIKNLLAGERALDAVERGIRITEDDETIDSVGYGGIPNAEGIVELDAAMMWGPGRKLGAVAGLREIGAAISVARKVMEETTHCLLVGDAAKQFAVDQGFQTRNMLTDKAKAVWEDWKRTGVVGECHDTVCVLAVDKDDNICSGTSTSGIFCKLPGRVGDTPLCGCGFYCDNETGAAAATGWGEDIMRYAMSGRVVEAMSRGASPEEACKAVMSWAVNDDPSLREHTTGIMAIDKSGLWGAAATKEGFSICLGTPNGVEQIEIEPV